METHLAFLMCLNLHRPLLGIRPGFVFTDFKDTSKEALELWQSLWKWPTSSLRPGFWGLLQRPTAQILGLADGCIAFLGFLTLANPAKMTGHHLARRPRSLIQFYFRMNFCVFGCRSYTVRQRQCHLVGIGGEIWKTQNKQNGLEGWLSGWKCLLCKHKDQCWDPQIHLEPGGRWGQYWRLSSSLYTDVAYMCPPHTGASHSVACIHIRHTKTIIKDYKIKYTDIQTLNIILWSKP